jgi:hypothetical protein
MISSRRESLLAATLTPKRLRLCELGLVELVILFQSFQEFFEIKFQKILSISLKPSAELRSFLIWLSPAAPFLHAAYIPNLIRFLAIIFPSSVSLVDNYNNARYTPLVRPH